MSGVGSSVVVTQLIVDASGSKQGVADFKASMESAKQAAVSAGNATASSFEQAQKRWTESLAKTDPVIKAQIKMEQELARQRAISARALELGIGTEQAHAAQLEKVRKIQQGYVNDAKAASESTTAMGKAAAFASSQLGPLIGVMSVATVLAFAKSVFDTAANLDEMAQQAGVGTEALQAYRAAMLGSGIEAAQTDQILARLTRTIGTAMEEGGKARDAFVRLGISFDQLKGGTEEVLPAVARGLLDIEDASERAKLEVDLFGKTGQKLESALKALVDPTSTLIEKQRALGQVLGTDVTQAADEAADRMTAAWNRMKNEMTPLIVSIMDKITDFIELNERAEKWINNSWLTAGIGTDGKWYANRAAYDAAQAPPKPAPSPLENIDTKNLLINGRPQSSGGFSSTNYDGVLSKLREEASLTGKTAAERAKVVALREAEAAKIKDGNGPLSAAEKIEISRLAVVQANADAAGKAAKKREEDAKKEQEELEKFNDILNKLNKEREDEEKKRAEAAKKLKQDQDDYLQDLRDGVTMAGMSRDEAERYNAVLRGTRDLHIEIGSAQAREIDRLVEARQETEKWRDVVDNIADAFGRFFEDVFLDGKNAFSNLWSTLKQGFFQILGDMAKQALIQPIIIPMVQQIFGAGGLGLISGGAGGGGLLGSLSGLGSLGSLAGIGSGGGILGSLGGTLSGGMNWLGGALGFATPSMIPSAAGLSGALTGGISTTSIPASLGAQTGSLFGSTTLGGFLGGAGLGSLAGSLIFGNKNDAGMGSMGGAAAGAAIGSIIPGVGTIIGGLLGGVLGGGLGSLTGSSNKGTIQNFTNNGLGSTVWKTDGGQNQQLAQQTADTISQALKTLQDAGVNVSMGNITGFSIGSDKSYVYDSMGGKLKMGGGDVQGVITNILDRILPSASGTDEITNSVIDRYRNNGGINASNITALANDIDAARREKDQAEQAQKDFQTQVDAFGPAIDAALKAITDPVGAQLDALLASQKARAAEAQRLGIDVSRLNALNDAELTQFLKALSYEDLQKLSSSLAQAGSMASELKDRMDAEAAAAAAAAAEQARAVEAAQKLALGFRDLSARLGDVANEAGEAARIAQNMANGWERARDALQGASRALGYSDAALSPQERYQNSRSELDRLRGLAVGGDVDAASTFASFQSQFLQNSLAYNGSTSAYVADRTMVQGQLDQLALASESSRSLAQQQADAMAEAVERLQLINESIRSGDENTQAKLDSLTAAVNEVAAQVKDSNLIAVHK